MRFLVLVLLLAAAHLALTPFAPGPKAWIGWPFAVDSKSWLSVIGGLPSQSGGLVTTLLAGIAGAGLLVAAAGLFWNFIPAQWWPAIVLVSAAASGLLYVLYFGVYAIVPLVLDLVLVLGVTLQHWTVSGLRGG